MATTVLECCDFAVVFLDSEGIDLDLPNTDQAVIFLTLLTHLSSFLIYNTKIFTTISSLSHVFTSFLSQCKQSMTADTMKFFHPKFLWLFRDVGLKLADKDGKETEPIELLRTQILTSETGEVSDLGKSLFSLFPSLESATLPVPTINKRDIQNIVEQQAVLKPTFNTAVDALAKKILHQVTKKRAVDGATLLNGRMFAVLASSYVEAMKKQGSTPDPFQIWQMFVQQQLEDCSKRLVQEYESEMEFFTEILPVEERNLMKIHERILGEKKRVLYETICRINPLHSREEEAQPLLDQLEEEIVQWKESSSTRKRRPLGGSLCQFTNRNHTASKEHCKKLLRDLTIENGLEEKVEHAVKDSHPVDIQTDIHSITAEYKKGAIGPATHEVLESGLFRLHQLRDKLSTIPGQPQNVRVARSGSQQIKLSWEPPVENPQSVEQCVVRQRSGECKEIARTTTLSVLSIESPQCEYQVIATNSHKTGLPAYGKKEVQCTIL